MTASARRTGFARPTPARVIIAIAVATSLTAALMGWVAIRPAAAGTASITATPEADSYVQAGSPNANKGTDRKLKAEGAPIVRSYVRFSVSGIPAGAPISSARLRLYAKTNATVGVSIHGGVSDETWGERTITYNNAPAFTTAPPLATSGALVSNRWIELTVTPEVGGNGPVTLVITTTNPSSLAFSSREEKSTVRPQLVVDYTFDDPPPGTDPILVGAGDIAMTPSGPNGTDQSTALLLDTIVSGNPGLVTVFNAGDNAYENGSSSDYTNYYHPTWGRHLGITKPVPGNHEYQTANASGYFGYFGPAAGDPTKGYYAYDLGGWRIYSLNSNIARGAGSAQEVWLRQDLAAHAGTACVAAIWHHPRFSSGEHGNDTSVSALWQALYDFDAEVIVNGHDHIYQRFAPQTASGTLDAARGLRQFVVGTGGRGLYSFGSNPANSEARNNTTWGVLKLTLHPTSYDFQFVPITGQSFTDSGSGVACH